MARVQIFHKIRGPHNQGSDPWMRRRNLLSMQDAQRRLQHTPDRQVLWCPMRREDTQGLPDHRATFYFGEEHRINPTARPCRQILPPPGGREPIRPYDEFTPAVSASAYCLADLLPCRGFRIWGNGVFQIKNQSISRQRFGFFQRPPIRPWHVQHATAWPTQLHQWESSLQSVMGR